MKTKCTTCTPYIRRTDIAQFTRLSTGKAIKTLSGVGETLSKTLQVNQQ